MRKLFILALFCGSALAQYIPPNGGGYGTQPITANIVFGYDFHEGSGTTVHNISGTGSAYNFNLTTGVPNSSALLPQWIPSGNGSGAGLSVGSDPLGTYGLNNASLGTSCQTIPVLQNAVETLYIQYRQPPATEVYNGSFTVDWILGSSSTTLGYGFLPYSGINPTFANNAGGNVASSTDDGTGTHVVAITISGSAVVLYIDGVQSQSITQILTNAYATQAVNFVFGCNKNQNMYAGTTPTSREDVYYVEGYSVVHSPQQIQLETAYLNYNLQITKGVINVLRPNGLYGAEAYNQVFVIGESDVQGCTSSGCSSTAAQYPFGTCFTTSNCFSGGYGYSTTLNSYNGAQWTPALSYGEGGTVGYYISDSHRACEQFNPQAYLHLAILKQGSNGISSSGLWFYANEIQLLKKCGYDVWIEDNWSLGNSSTDQTGGRDAQVINLTGQAVLNGAKGVIDIAQDALIGADGKNGTAPYWAAVSPHLTAQGYAYNAQVVARVLNNYYGSSAIPVNHTASTYQMLGTDLNVSLDQSSNNVAATLPDCIGMSGAPLNYNISTQGTSLTNTITLAPATVSGQTETLLGSASSITLAQGLSYQFTPYGVGTASSQPGGCNWVRTR